MSEQFFFDDSEAFNQMADLQERAISAISHNAQKSEWKEILKKSLEISPEAFSMVLKEAIKTLDSEETVRDILLEWFEEKALAGDEQASMHLFTYSEITLDDTLIFEMREDEKSSVDKQINEITDASRQELLIERKQPTNARKSLSISWHYVGRKY